MAEIVKGQMLEVENLYTFRGQVSQIEVENIGKELEEIITKNGAQKVGNPISVTYGIEGSIMDMELLIPIDKEIENVEPYCFKEKIKIVNALLAKHKGNPMMLQNTFNEVNHYIVENKLTPITPGYNVTKTINPLNMENCEIYVYIGISPNVL